MADLDPSAPRPRAHAAAAAWIGRPFRARVRRRPDGASASPRISVRRAARLVAAGVAGIAIVFGALWLAILYLPLPASQVVPRVVAALQERLGPDYAVAIADAELHRGGNGVELRLVDLSIALAGGGPVLAEAPRVELRVDGMSLLTGQVKVRSVHVTNPRLDMQFDTTGGAASVKTDLPRRIAAGVADLDRLLGPDGAAGALEEVEVSNATLLVAPRSRAPLSLDGVDLRLSRGQGSAIALTASSARTDQRWTTAVTISPTPDRQGRVLDLGLENIDLAPYSAPFAEKVGAVPLKGRLSGHLNAKISADGKLLAGEGRVSARAIAIALPGPPLPPGAAVPTIEVEALQLNLGWDPAKGALMVEPSRVSGRGGQMTFSGSFTAPSADETRWVAALEGRDVLLSAEVGGEPPLRLDRIVVEATFDPAAGALEIGKAQFLGPTAKAAATGLIRFEGASPAIRLGLVSEPMPASAMKRMWPFFMASEARAWALENVRAGTVDGLSLSLDIPSGVLAALKPKEPLPVGSMALDVSFSNAVLRGRPGLPWVEGAAGHISATARKVTATVGQGFVAQGQGALTISNIRFDVPETGGAFPKATVAFRAEGALDPAVALLASGAVGPNPLPPQLDASKVSGKVVADVNVGFELGHEHDASPPPATVAVNADVTDLTIANVFAGRNFEKGAFKIVVAGGKTDVTGKGRVGGAPATVSVVETPETPTTPRKRQLRATLTADAGDLTRMGFDVPGVLKGAVPLEASFALDEPGAPIALTADLKTVGIDGVVPGFRKPAGQAGKLGFIIATTPEKTTIKDFVIESGDRSVRGTIEFGPKGELLSATLPIYRPAPGDDARVEIDKARSGAVKVAVQGAALDLKPLLDAFRGKSAAARAAASTGGAPAPSTMPKNLDVTAKLGTGLGYGGEALAGLDLTIAMRDGKVTDADGSGRVGRGVIKLATTEDGRLRLSGEDAGAFFRLTDLYGRIDGGVFDLQASLIGGPGLLRVRDFSVRNDDALVRVRQTTGADAAAATRAGSTGFDRLRVEFVEGRGKIAIQEASLYGPQLGATLGGVVDYSADQVSLVGTFVPAYALNNLVSKVPIIGALLGGGAHGGLVGVTFQVKGKTASPTVTINPISAVAPGFLRKLFEFKQDAADTTSSTPAKTPE